MRIKETLIKPYYSNTNFGFRLMQASLFGAFVALFLIIFQPFQISNLGENWWLIAIGFGSVTFGVMVLLNILLPLFFKKYFEGENWTVKKEIIHSSLNLISIGAANSVYFLYIVVDNFSWEIFFRFQFFTFCVGIAPIIVLALLRERKDYNRYVHSSESLNSDFQAKGHHEPVSNENPIQIQSKNLNENITIDTSNFLLIKAMDNYLEVYSKESKNIVRNTLKTIEENLSDQAHIFRCHKSYIVNLDKVISISGNAQGYKLQLSDYDAEVPVSRSLNEEIKKRLLSLT